MGLLTGQTDVGNIGVKQLKEQRQITTQRWEKLGLLEGLNGVVKENCAQLFENQLTYMMNLNESSDSGNSGQFETVAFPLIRRVFSKLLANELVSVQALNLPIGKLFFFNPKISTRGVNGRHTSPDGAYRNAATTPENDKTQFESRSLYDSYYANDYRTEGESLYNRSKGAATAVTGVVTLSSPYVVGDKYLQGSIGGFSTTNKGKLVGPQGAPMDTEVFLSSLKITANQTLAAPAEFAEESKVAGSYVDFNVKVQDYGKAIVDAAGNLKVVIDLTYPGADGYGSALVGTSAVVFSFAYNTYSNLEEDSEMAEITFELDEVTVSVDSRKMRAQWTPELAQDVSAFQNIDAEAELTALLSEQMAAEIDREILRDLRRGAAWTLKWDYNGLRKQSTMYFGTQKDYNQTLITKINQVSAQIHKSTLRGGANWIVVSSEVSAVFDDLTYFHVSNAAPDQDKFNLGMEKVGSLGGRYQVYRDPYAPASTILIGHKGSSILDSGYIYAPYVPMQLTPVMNNPFDFKPIRGIMSRYAKKLVINRYYGRIDVDGLQYFADILQ